MSNTRLKILLAIKEYIDKEKISPTVREIAEIVGLKSTSSVHRHISMLENDGYITRRQDSPRSLRVINIENGFSN